MSLKNKILRRIPYDERIQFNDLSKVKPKKRKQKSRILNFYSSVDNIGNYTPLLGIHKLAGEEFDAWCIHSRRIDWEYINKNYDGVIIGGAGLIGYGFTNFWVEYNDKCNLPTIIWGVGGLFQKDINQKQNVDSLILKKAFAKCDLINLRDDLSANYVDAKNV